MRVILSEINTTDGPKWQVEIAGASEPFALGAWSKGTAKRKARELQADIDGGRILPGLLKPKGTLGEMQTYSINGRDIYDHADILVDGGMVGTVHNSGYAPQWAFALSQYRFNKPYNAALQVLQDGAGYDSPEEALAVAVRRIEDYETVTACNSTRTYGYSHETN